MLRNYLKSAIRNLLKNKVFSFLNITGLAIGMTSSMLIANYIVFETSFDQFHLQGADIYRLTHEFYQNGELKSRSAAAYAPLAPAIANEIPEVRKITRIHPAPGTVTAGEAFDIINFHEENIYFVDSDFFEIFSFRTLAGNSNNPLGQNNSLVLTEKTAHKYFGKQTDPIGRNMYWNNGDYSTVFTVTAILEDVPENSHLQFDFLLPFSMLESLDSDGLVPLSENWGWPGFYTYILTEPETDPGLIEVKLRSLTEKYAGATLKSWNDGGFRFYTQPLTDIHLYSNFGDELTVNGNAVTIQFLGLIAVFVLLIAYINYINLSVAGSIQRAREIGVRKLMGSKRSQLIRQFLLESLLVYFMAFSLGVIGYYLTLPYLHLFTGKAMPDALWGNVSAWYIILLFLLGALISSLYPAFVLTGFNPVKVLKSTFNQIPKDSLFRKSLVTFQFIASISMVTGSLVVYKQIDYIRHKDLGVKLDEILTINGPHVSAHEENLSNQISSFKTNLLKQKFIKRVSFSNAVPGTGINHTMMYKRAQEDWENGKVIRLMNIDFDFADQYEVSMRAGKKFDATNTRDMLGKTLLINEAAARQLGFENPEEALNAKIVSAIGEEREVIGLVRNYHQKSAIQSFEPLLFVINPKASDYISIKLQASNGTDLKNALGIIEETYRDHFPADAFNYFFMDDFFDRQYEDNIYFMRLFSFFTLLCIFVACLGLFGLASYTTRQRKKEIGIRKVMGASFLKILTFLSIGYLKLLTLAFLIAFPLCNYLITEWLKNYAFKIHLNGWFFIIPALAVIVVALLAVGGQSVNAASINPSKALREE